MPVRERAQRARVRRRIALPAMFVRNVCGFFFWIFECDTRVFRAAHETRFGMTPANQRRVYTPQKRNRKYIYVG